MTESLFGNDSLTAAFLAGQVIGAERATKHIQTHLSDVFVGQERVYKVKRAVRLPFVDFSTLNARREACEAELALNRRMAPRLYERVAALSRDSNGTWHLGRSSEGEQYCVVMRNFGAHTLRDIALRGELSVAIAVDAARAAARLHSLALPDHLRGHLADYLAILDGLMRTETDAAAALDLKPGSSELFDHLAHTFRHHAPVIEARQRMGHVRHGHGDLHLGNICIFEGEVTLFDALEFDPALATADVLYDIAFLLMDLRVFRLREHASAAMNAYWDEASVAPEALALLPAFMALRAAVRMAVSVASGNLEDADRYRVLGLDLLAVRKPMCVAVGGLSGTGKSVAAQAIAHKLPGVCGARILRTDILRPAQDYDAAARLSVYEQMFSQARACLKAGSSVILDATFALAETQAALAASGLLLDGAFWLTAPAEIRLARVEARKDDASKADERVASAQRAPSLDPQVWTPIEAGGDRAQTVASILGALTRKHALVEL